MSTISGTRKYKEQKMKGQRKSVWGSVLLVIVFGVLSVLAADLVLRFVYPQKTLFPRYIDSHDYPIAFPKDTKLVHSQGSHWNFVYTTNQLGLRGPFLPIQDEYTTTNVVVLGDSFTFGFGVNDNETYPSIISTVLKGDYAVVNGGMGGWGIDTEIKWYFKTGRQYHPRYVVLQFAANDPEESSTGITRVENGEFAFYPNTNARPKWQLFLSRSRIIQNSHLYALLRNVYDSHLAHGSFSVQRDRSARINASEPKVDRRQVNYAEMLELFARKLHEQNVALIFLSVTHSHKEPDIYHYDLNHFPYIEQTVKRLRAAGVLEFLDLHLVELKKYPGSVEGHQWSAAHHKLVGEEIAKKIRVLEGLADPLQSRNSNR